MKLKKYYRKITDLFPRALIIFVWEYLFIFLTVLLLVVLYALVIMQNIYEDRVTEYDRKEQQYVYWVQTADQYPYAPDVLYNAALSALEVNNRERALFYIDRALQVDPLFSKADEMRKKLIE